jgi:hypothetical protein
MTSFMAQAAWSAVRACLPMSARISAGQLGVSNSQHLFRTMNEDGGERTWRPPAARQRQKLKLAGEAAHRCESRFWIRTRTRREPTGGINGGTGISLLSCDSRRRVG